MSDTDPTAPTVLEFTPEPRHDAYAAFRSRNYSLFAIANTFGTVGAQIQYVAAMWELWHRTDSFGLLAWLGLLQASPIILFALPAGHVADAFNRRAILMITMTISGLCSVGMAVLNFNGIRGSAWVAGMFALMFIRGAALTFYRPARNAMMPSLVPQRDFHNAVAWNSSLFELSAMLGPALAGFVVARSIGGAYLLTACCHLFFFPAMMIVRVAEQKKSAEKMTTRSIIAGLRFVFRSQAMLGAMTLDLLAVLLGGIMYLLPAFAEKILHVGPVGFGWLRAAPAIGAFSMAIAIAHFPPFKKAGRALLMAVAAYGVATIVFGLSKNYWLSFAALLLTGAFDNISVVVRHTMIQLLTPDEMRGRVAAVNQVFIVSSNDLGGWESGVTAKLWGPVASVVVGGIGTIAVTAFVGWWWPVVRKIGALRDLKPLEQPAP